MRKQSLLNNSHIKFSGHNFKRRPTAQNKQLVRFCICSNLKYNFLQVLFRCHFSFINLCEVSRQHVVPPVTRLLFCRQFQPMSVILIPAWPISFMRHPLYSRLFSDATIIQNKEVSRVKSRCTASFFIKILLYYFIFNHKRF